MSTPAPTASFDLTSGPFRLTAAPGVAGRFAAEGPLTFASARSARQIGLEALDGAPERQLEIDCQGVTVSDSAGLAVLLEWLAAARALKCSLRFLHLPAGVVALGRISEVSELLERGV